jgi:hypothetical protein
MKNAWVKYTVIRLGLFIGLSAVFGLLTMPWFAAVPLAAMLSFAYSLFFLSGLRDQISKELYEKRANSLGSGDPESDLENEIVDLEVKAKKSPAKTKGK